MQNPIKEFLSHNQLTTSGLARDTGMNQPTIYRHTYYDQPMTFASMESYYQAGIPWDDLISWNQFLLYREEA